MSKNFQSKMLGEICNEIYRYPSYYGITYVDKGVPEVRGELILKDGTLEIDRTQWRFITQETASKFPRTTLKTGDLVMSVRGTIGNIGLIPPLFEGANITANLIRISPRKDLVEPRFLWHFMRTESFQTFLNHISPSTTIKTIRAPDIKAVPIPLPPLAEQRRIAAILDRADAVRRKRQEAIALTEELLRSAFLEMFGDPVTNPKGWEICQLDQFAEIQSGIAKGKKVDYSKAISVPYMRVANVQDGYLNLTEIKKIDVLPTDIARYSLKQGDLLLTEGGDPDKLGRGAVWYGAIHPCIHQNHIFCVRPDRDIAEPEYLSSLIGSEYGKRYFLKAAKQTTGIATINKTQLQNFPAFLPPLELQQKYTQLVLSIRATREKLESVDKQTDLFFNSLLQRAFRGEL